MTTVELLITILGSSGLSATVSAWAAVRVVNRKAQVSEAAIAARAMQQRQEHLDDAANEALKTQADLLKEAADRLIAEGRRADDNQLKRLEAEAREEAERKRAEAERKRADEAEQKVRDLEAKHDANAQAIAKLEGMIKGMERRFAELESENRDLRAQLRNHAGPVR